MWTVKDYQFMSYAIRLAKYGKYTCNPNPLVGCVITRNDNVIAEGWHKTAGEPHAEINALNACDSAIDATMYVTLEPCSYQGRTPPCIDALINAKIKKAFISMVDPNPKVSGLGIEKLKKSGIEIQQGLLETEAKKLNTGFIKRMKTGLPYIRCKMAQSLDGATALANGNSQWITSVDARRDAHNLRAASSAILTSAETIIRDNPLLNPRDLGCDFKEPIKVIVDRNFRVPENAKIFDLGGRTIIYTQIVNDTKKKKLRDRDIDIICLIKSDTWLNDICKNLVTEYEVNEVLIESGPKFSGAMIDEGLVDELVIYMAPKLFGNESFPLFNLKKIDEINYAREYEFSDIRKVGKDLRLTMVIKK